MLNMNSNLYVGKGSSEEKLAEEEKVESALAAVPLAMVAVMDVSTTCKRTYPANDSRINLSGLNEGSKTDFSDCELAEGSSGEVQERWENAFSRRKRDFQNYHSDVRDDNGEKDDDSSCFGCADETGNSTLYVEENRKRTPELKSRVDEEESMNKDLYETETLSQKQIDHSLSRLPDDENSEEEFLGRLHDEEAELKEVDISKSNIQLEEDKDIEKSLLYEEMCVIIDREKLKETDGYKRAMEEEWASRKQAIQIQSEEAKNLRRLQKKRKAESLRSSDMERRQKERIEEVRNSLKKDEENMILKERIRAELRSELEKLEVSGHSMACVLNSLGISVGGWPNPSPQEVQRAYKRALLTFHPDRASKSDIRQQVEAEEKFKLINRLKEKCT